MSARAIGSATVSFGLVSIPVKIYPASSPTAAVRFNMIHRSCGSRVKQQYWCPQDETIVPRDELARGYEFARGQYVLFSDEEIKALQPKATQEISIAEFVPIESVDPLHFDSAYYLGPDKGGDRAYALLATSLGESGRCALARYAARGKQYLVMLRPHGEGLVMQQLRYAEELRSIDEVPLGSADVEKRELELALQIIEQGVSDRFDPTEYRDEVREAMLARIEEKVEGKEITEAPADEPRAQVIDLLDALKASVGDTKRRPAKQSPRSKKTKARANKKTRASAKKAAR